MRTGKLIFVTSLLFGYVLGWSQSVKPLLPSLAPASPEASSFTKYGNYEVNLFTGIPDISIPLYEIQVGELKVPINLSYHPSGIKVSDIPSRVGLGWDLQAGGSITRKIVGKPDEFYSNYLAPSAPIDKVPNPTAINTTSINGLQYLDDVRNGLHDVEPDIFSYNFPGHSGKFFFNQKDSFKAFLIPYAPVSVNYNLPTMSTLNLSMADESGVNYIFGAQESTQTFGGGNPLNCTSAWLLSDMITANKQDTVHFVYTQKTGSGNTDSYFSDYMTLTDNCVGSMYQPDNGNGQFYTDSNVVSTTWQQLNEIDFKNGKVVFESDPQQPRTDFAGHYQLQHQLNNIKIYSYSSSTNTYTLIRTIKFNYSYFIQGSDANTKRLRLDSLQFVSSLNEVAQTYSFNYNTTITLPTNTSRTKDYWGYFNNQHNYVPGDPNGRETMVRRDTVTVMDGNSHQQSRWVVGGNNLYAREPNKDYMQAYILQKINFPTGGYTRFAYKTNQYLDDNNNPHYAGGLRIDSIISYASSTATPLIKTYKYGANESGYGRANFALEDHYFMSVQNYRYDGVFDGSGSCSFPQPTCTKRTYFANPTNDLEGWDGAPIVYPTVTEYMVNGTAKNGKTVYTFLDKPDAKIDIIGLGKPYYDSYHFIRGLPGKKAVYKINPDNTTYTLLTEDRKGYQFFPYQWSTGGVGLVVFKLLITSTTGSTGDDFCGTIDTPLHRLPCMIWNDEGNYAYNFYNVVSGDNKLVSDTSITYDQSNFSKSIVTITHYTYDDLTHLQVSKEQTTDSKGQNLTTTNTYPYTYSTLPYTAMTEKHIFNKLVSTAQSIDGSPIVPLTAQYNNYDTYPGNNYEVDSIQTTTGTGGKQNRAYFNIYDGRGNVLDMQKTNDVHMSYQWGYDNMYPVAQVANAQNYYQGLVTTPGTIQAGITAPANTSGNNPNTTTISTPIIVTHTGAVIITLGNGQGTTETVSGSISGIGPTPTSVSVTLGAGCNYGSSTAFNNVQPGTYSITITLSATHSFGFCGTISYPGDQTQTVTRGVKEFFYTSFEDSAANQITSNTCTGKRSYDNSSIKYVVPFDKSNNRAYVIDYHYRSTGKWIAISKPFTDHMTLTEGDAIDEVRVHPKDAQMTTYTYAPLIGMTSQCDAANHVTTYEYDGLGRLTLIRDQDGNIVKKIDYHYNGDTEINTANCNCTDVSAGKKCINGQCEQGTRQNQGFLKMSDGTWRCTYKWNWSSGLPSGNQYEYNATPCFVN